MLAAEQPVSPRQQRLLEELAHKAAEARAHGYWVVGAGEHLRLIARQFCPGDKLCERHLSERILAHNKNAFFDGDPDRMRPGARLDMSGEVLEPAAVAQPKAAAPVPSQAAMPATPSPSTAAAPTPSASAPPVACTVCTRAGRADLAATVGIIAREQRHHARIRHRAARSARHARAASLRRPADRGRHRGVGSRDGGRRGGARARAALVLGRIPHGSALPPGRRARPRAGRESLDAARDAQTYGDLYIDAGVRDNRPAPGEIDTGRPQGGRFTLYQQRFPLTQGWLADSGLGVVRTPPSALVNSSYRVYLPTSLMAGANTIVSDGKQEVSAYAGHIGQLLGDAVQSFDPTSGNVAGLGYTTRNGPWTVGGQAIALRGNSQVADHEGATLAAEYGQFGAIVHDKAQLVADNGRARRRLVRRRRHPRAAAPPLRALHARPRPQVGRRLGRQRPARRLLPRGLAHAALHARGRPRRPADQHPRRPVEAGDEDRDRLRHVLAAHRPRPHARRRRHLPGRAQPVHRLPARLAAHAERLRLVEHRARPLALGPHGVPRHRDRRAEQHHRHVLVEPRSGRARGLCAPFVHPHARARELARRAHRPLELRLCPRTARSSSEGLWDTFAWCTGASTARSAPRTTST